MGAKKPNGANGTNGLNGKPAVDPTRNVLDLVDARDQRHDDLRDAERRYFDAENQHNKEIGEMRAEHAQETRAYDNDRWDKIRTIDMANAESKASQILTAVNNYSAAQERMAQTLRDQVASTADAANKNLSALINPIVDRVAILERSSYTVAGRSAVSDPAMADMVIELRKLTAAGAASTGKDAGINLVWVAIGGVVSIIVGLIVIGTFVFITMRPAPTPYIPAAPGTMLPTPAPAVAPR